MKTIREWRELKGWSQAKLAAEASVSPSTIYNWEAGRFEPKATQLRRVAKALGVSMDDIELVELAGKELATHNLAA